MIDETEAPRTRGNVLRRVLLMATPVLVVIGAVRFGLWWGAESQHAMIRGRRWPPESLMVFFGR